MESTKTRWLGRSVRRFEDRRLLTADTSFVDDLVFPDLLHVAVLRSPHAHAKLLRVDISKALKHPGVVAVVTGEDARKLTKPIPAYAVSKFKSEEYCLAVGKVRYVGDPIAAVAAIDRETAEDALEDIDVEYEVLPAVIDPLKAMAQDAPLVFESFGTNIVAQYSADWGQVDKAFQEADVVIKERLYLHRYSSTPLETVSVVAKYEPGEGQFTYWANVQMPGHVMMAMSDLLGVSTNKIHLVVRDIGGGFGIKTRPWRVLLIVSLLAMKVKGRHVKYWEDRSEHLASSGQTAGMVVDIEAAAKKDGKILGFKFSDINDDGASIQYAGTYASMHATLISGCYDIRNIKWESRTVLTNTCPSMPNRGVGKPGIVYIVERMAEFVSQKLGLDPAQVRMRNFIPPDRFPYATVSGRVYDSGNYPLLLKKALDVFGYEDWRRKQQEYLKQGRFVGIGICSYVHGASATAKEIEGATIKVDSKGNVVVTTGSPDMGTSHTTAICQILAEIVGVKPETVKVLPFDSDYSPWTPYSGTHANKFSGPDVEAIVGAARKIREKLVRLAASKFQVDPSRVEISDGNAWVTGSPEHTLTIQELAKAIYQNPGLLPEGLEAGLEATFIGNSPSAIDAFKYGHQFEVGALHQLVTGSGSPTGYMTYPSSVHVVAVEVDAETGETTILRYVIVHDVGREINPMIVQGQLHGGASHGISVAMREGFVYDDNGQLLTSTFMDYLKPTMMEMPDIIDDKIETPSPRSSLGIKGMGEGETLGPLAAIPNAVEDALRPLRIRINRIPLRSEMIYQLIKGAKSEG
jgi:2-furoyl-CoA dehydrogenase large subunit